MEFEAASPEQIESLRRGPLETYQNWKLPSFDIGCMLSLPAVTTGRELVGTVIELNLPIAVNALIGTDPGLFTNVICHWFSFLLEILIRFGLGETIVSLFN